jgi:hypothetical protein
MLKGIFILSCVSLLWGTRGLDGRNWAPPGNRLSNQPTGIRYDHSHAVELQPDLPAETPKQWVELGRRIHGRFGSYIALALHWESGLV